MSEFLINSVSLNSAQKLTITADFLNNVSTGMIFRDARGVIIDCNHAAETLLGTSREKLLGTTTTEMESGVVHLDGSPFTFDEPWAITALRSQTPMTPVVAGFVVPDGSRIWLSVRIWPAVVGGEIAGILTAFDDVSREVKEQRFLELLNSLKHLGSLGLDEDELLKQITELVVNEGRYALAWIGAASLEGGIDILSSSGVTDYLYDGIVSWWGSSESGLGPTGTAIRTSATQVAEELSTYPLYGPWRERVANFNLRSAISLPITLGAKKAALSIYDEHTRAFDDLSVQGLETIGREIESAYSIAAAARQREVDREWSNAAVNALKRAELSLSKSEQWFRTLVAKSSDLIVVDR